MKNSARYAFFNFFIVFKKIFFSRNQIKLLETFDNIVNHASRIGSLPLTPYPSPLSDQSDESAQMTLLRDELALKVTVSRICFVAIAEKVHIVSILLVVLL